MASIGWPGVNDTLLSWESALGSFWMEVLGKWQTRWLLLENPHCQLTAFKCLISSRNKVLLLLRGLPAAVPIHALCCCSPVDLGSTCSVLGSVHAGGSPSPRGHRRCSSGHNSLKMQIENQPS